jgi:KDO2-lipid IV(A) lauroyltransferase
MIDILNALRRNEIVAMLCDRDSTNTPATVDFFGHPFTVPMGPALLGLLTGAPLIPSFVVYRAGMYEAFTGRPIFVTRNEEEDRDETVKRMTVAMAREFEKVIGRFPDQWYNFYPAWSTGNGSGNGRAPGGGS